MSAVAATTAGNGMPAPERMTALTTRMYDMTRKVVMPPRTSVPIVEPAARTWNCRSIQSVVPPTAAVRAAMSPSSATLTPMSEVRVRALEAARPPPGRAEHTFAAFARLDPARRLRRGRRHAFRRYVDHRARPNARALLRTSERRGGI